jgi:rod shape-determining protein MreC
MQSFQRFDRTTSLLIGLLVVAFVLATFDVRGNGSGIATTMRDGAQSLFAPLQEAASAVTRPVVGFIDALSDLASLRRENETLRNQVAELEQQAQQFDSIKSEYEHLQELNNLEVPGELPTVVARVQSPGASSFDLAVWLNKGSDDAISVGDAVVDEQGLVGRVDLVFDTSARVRLLVDPNFSVWVRDEVTSQTGQLRGRVDSLTGTADLVLRVFEAESPAEAGSVLVTAGTRFPPGLVVGTVVETATDAAGFGLVTSVQPAVDLTRLDYVKVIVGFSPLDEQPADETQSEDPAATEGGDGGETSTTLPSDGSEGADTGTTLPADGGDAGASQ